jgi:hypothetical protein
LLKQEPNWSVDKPNKEFFSVSAIIFLAAMTRARFEWLVMPGKVAES